MKKLLAITFSILMIISAFAGCGMSGTMSEEVSTMMTNASEMMSENKNNGEVTDGDGFISENDDEDNNKQNSTLNDGLGETTNSTSATNSTGSANSTGGTNNTNNTESTNNSTSSSKVDSVV